MKTMRYLLILFISALMMYAVVVPEQVYAKEVSNIRLWHAPERTRVVLDLDQNIKYKMFTLTNPARVVVDLMNVDFNAKIPRIDANNKVIDRIRVGQYKKTVFRVVFDVKTKVKPILFLLKPNAQYGYRLVVDLNNIQLINREINTITAKNVVPKRKKQQLVIAIDAGHGGEDPGATGKYGTREKDVVLVIAKKIARRINQDKRMRAVLVRTGDYYIALGKRTLIARKHNADIFISVHADAVKQRSVKGTSVYALSDRRATSEIAKWLAEKENSSDLAGGISLSDKDDDVANVLLDLAMDNTKSESIILAKDVLAQLRKIGPVLRGKVERAGFSVLKSPDIPSILIETAFISNPREEKKLKSTRFQNLLANSIYNGIRQYAKRGAYDTLVQNE